MALSGASFGPFTRQRADTSRQFFDADRVDVGAGHKLRHAYFVNSNGGKVHNFVNTFNFPSD
jgi:hypothetical protein